jgi:hypothetical protein
MITVTHLAERLELLAAWRMPYGPRPTTPPPCCEHVLLREAASALRRLDADLTIQCSRQHTRAAADRAAALAATLPALKDQPCECGMQGLQDMVIETLTCSYDALIFAHRVNPHLGAEGRKQYFETLRRILAVKSALQDDALKRHSHS